MHLYVQIVDQRQRLLSTDIAPKNMITDRMVCMNNFNQIK